MDELPERLPPITDDLIAALETIFPNRCPSIRDSDREVWTKAGAAGVVEWLRMAQGIQRENLLQSLS